MVSVLILLLSFLQTDGFRATLVVEEGDEESRYGVDFKMGAIRVTPEEEGVYFIVDTESRLVTLVRTDERIYCRFDPQGLRRFSKSGAVNPRWFPWLYRVGPDIVEDLALRELGEFRLPDGRQGRHWSAYSRTYDRVVAEYWLDPQSSGDLFFQWSTIYLDFWGEGDENADRAQQARLDIYKRLEGLPVKMEERLHLLTRARTLRIENRQPLPADAFDVPMDYEEKTPAALFWEDIVRRWFRPKGIKP
jgi:hypothetical protein